MEQCKTPMELALDLINWWRSQPKPAGPALWPRLRIAKDFRDLVRPKDSRARIVKLRPASSIVGITLHQTATRDFAPTHSGLDDVPAHAMVHRDGSVSLLHHPTAYVYHGHALNAGTIGIEIACRAAGTEGDERTFWRSASEKDGWERKKNALGKFVKTGRFVGIREYDELVNEATDAQLSACCELVRYYVGLCPSVNGLWAHRQGDESRTSDPGSRIWLGVAEPMRLELRLKDRNDMKLGTGNANPREWRAP